MGLEIGVLSELQRNYSLRQLCQVDIADAYDHKHQPISEEDPNGGLNRMSLDISKALYRKLATQGVTFSSEDFRTLKATYYRFALDLIEAYDHDATMNGLSLDRHSEEQAVELLPVIYSKQATCFWITPESGLLFPVGTVCRLPCRISLRACTKR
ncbi:hypothetical protein HSBAA_19480 [Vreelandella sulfidaeris]|uniref:Uncharacterized protein n=1 Tax=Vreelandella sulfidaeris TaxID=115553 RepID=A0A455U3K8_9GAMM|nr:hypothetical protein HSBAA_19480 [Halomonas sulfidaeris]